MKPISTKSNHWEKPKSLSRHYQSQLWWHELPMIIHVRVWILPELNLAARTHHPQYPLSSRGPWNEFKSQGEGTILPQRGASQAATRQTGRAGCAWALLDSWTSCAWNQILPSAKHFPLSMKSALNPPHLQGHWWHCQVAPGSKCFRDSKLFFLPGYCNHWEFPPVDFFPTVVAAVALEFWTFPLFLFSSSFTGSFTLTPW